VSDNAPITSPERIRVKHLFLLLIIAASCFAGDNTSLPDSIHAQLWAGAQVSDQAPAGVKGTESGMLDASMAHWFSDAVFCRLYVRGTPSFQTPFVEEASLGYRHADFLAKAGMLSTHVGRAMLYKPFSVFNQFTRTSVAWDSYGFGFGLDAGLGAMRLSGAATFNTRENGAAHVMWTAVNNSSVCERVLAGIQTANLDNGDNDLTLGDDFTLSLKPFDLHAAAQYTVYQGYGNPTIKPGRLIEGFLEARLVPITPLTLSAEVFYENLEKGYLFVSSPANQLQYLFESVLCGIDAQYMPIAWLGMYAGYEYQRNGSAGMHVPQAGIALVPFARQTLLRVGWESDILGSAAIHRAVGVLWFEY
jgi:hypothetical protein